MVHNYIGDDCFDGSDFIGSGAIPRPAIKDFSITERYYTEALTSRKELEWGSAIANYVFRLQEVSVTPNTADYFILNELTLGGLILIKNGNQIRPFPITAEKNSRRTVSFTNMFNRASSFEITFKGIYLS